MDDGDVGMIERCQQLGLPVEPGHPFEILGEFLGQHLDGYPPVQGFVEGGVNLAHSPVADLLKDLNGCRAWTSERARSRESGGFPSAERFS